MTTTATFLSLDGLRAAVVDDNPYFRRIVRTMLTGLGFRGVLEGSTVEEGWQIVAMSHPDILLLDWNLGPGSGVALLDRIRTHPDPGIATQMVVFLSAHSDKRHVLKAASLGANDFIVKPVSARQLYDRIRRIVSARVRYERRAGRLVPIGPSGPARAPEPRTATIINPRTGAGRPATTDDVLFI